MTYNVFGGTLSLALSICLSLDRGQCIQSALSLCMWCECVITVSVKVKLCICALALM